MNEISNWLKSEEKDYQVGLSLLVKYGKNRQLSNFLGRKECAHNLNKLTYELEKLAPLAEVPEDTYLEDLNSKLNAAAAGDKDSLKASNNGAGHDKPVIDPNRSLADLHEEHEILNQELNELEFGSVAFNQKLAIQIDLTERIIELEKSLKQQTNPDYLKELKDSISQKDFEDEVINKSVPPVQTPDAKHEELIKEINRLYHEGCKLSNSLADCKSDVERKLVTDAILANKEEYNKLAVIRQHFEEHGTFPQEPLPASAPEPPSDAVAQLKVERTKLSPNVSKAKKAAEKDPENVLKAEKYAKLKIELDSLNAQIKLLS